MISGLVSTAGVMATSDMGLERYTITQRPILYATGNL